MLLMLPLSTHTFCQSPSHTIRQQKAFLLLTLLNFINAVYTRIAYIHMHKGLT